jgi:hypothetical protein
MSCRNPNSKISAEITETIETLGIKFQNALEEAVLFYAKNSPGVQVLRFGSLMKGGSYGFF